MFLNAKPITLKIFTHLFRQLVCFGGTKICIFFILASFLFKKNIFSCFQKFQFLISLIVQNGCKDMHFFETNKFWLKTFKIICFFNLINKNTTGFANALRQKRLQRYKVFSIYHTTISVFLTSFFLSLD